MKFIMRTTHGLALIAVSAATLLLACSSSDSSSEKQDVSNESDAIAFSHNWTVLGSLDYGQTSPTISYTSTPKYRAYKFAGNTGDAVDVWVRSTNGGDSVAWVLDNDFKIVGHNDDADGTTLDSHITAKLPANASATHYVVVRDYNYASKHFTIALNGTAATPVWESCNVDSDCEAVPQVGCCNNGYKAAVNKHHVTAYEDSFTCPPPKPFCPLFVILDTRQPECNNTSHTCEMVAIDQISCGGFVANHHACPSGYDCSGASNPDLPGKCSATPVAGSTCGGIAGIACAAGLTCVDNPDDSCDPAKGGADCSGECVDVSAATACGGIAARTCPSGLTCVDDPTDSCDPAKGGADCGGICVN